MQNRHFVRGKHLRFWDHLWNDFFKFFSLLPESKKLLTKFVNYFAMDSVPASCVKRAWEGEISAVLPDKIWRTALSRIHSCSVNSRHRLIQFQVNKAGGHVVLENSSQVRGGFPKKLGLSADLYSKVQKRAAQHHSATAGSHRWTLSYPPLSEHTVPPASIPIHRICHWLQ